MPVTGLFFIPELNLTSASATLSLLVDRLSKLHHLVPGPKWAFEHRLYREAPLPTPSSPAAVSIPHQPAIPSNAPSSTNGSQAASVPGGPMQSHKTLQVLDLSTYPQKFFALAASTIVTIDRDFEALVRSKMNALWNIRQTLKGQGEMYDIDDFKVKLATVAQGQDVKGVILEVEYTPCQYLSQAEPILRDFVDQLKIPQAREFFRPRDVPEGDEDKIFTILDTSRQYMELLRMR
ncbi:mediator complex, subunit Med20 [Kalaharituber pfeilii]|nr:mediator complex, subunit Med20 [Kalaharituber pfeilii]